MNTSNNQRILISRYGGSDTMHWVEAAILPPKADEVVLRVEAAGVAFADVLMRRGLYPAAPQPPFSPGYDVVGIVEAVGERVTTLNVGDRVAALTQYGGYSQYVRLAAWRCVPVPEGVDPAEAVALVLNYITAHQMLHRVVGVEAGESILIHGAAGGVGTALLQLGQLAGLELYGTASRAKHDIVRQYGGVPIDYRRDDFIDRTITVSGDGVDAVFDPIGGNHWVRSYQVLHVGGTLVMYGASAALQNGERNPASLLPGVIKLGMYLFVPDGRRTVGYFIATATMRNRQAYRDDLAYLLQLLKNEKIRPHIGERMALHEAARAHDLLENAQVMGKIVLMA